MALSMCCSLFQRYMMKEPWATQSLYHVTCTKEESWVLDRLMTPFWMRPKYYPDDPYAQYHLRNGIRTSRVNYSGKTMTRERKKILVEDTVADHYFRDR